MACGWKVVGSESLNDKLKARKRRNRQIAAKAFLALRKGQRYLPPLIRALCGLCLVGLGFLGFLPVLGFWMIPLGLALIATDIPPLGRWLRRRIYRLSRDNRY